MHFQKFERRFPVLFGYVYALFLFSAIIECAHGGHSGGGAPDIRNCSFMYFEQPLDHFNGVRDTFSQRVCVYTRFVKDQALLATAPLLFYTGNEGEVGLYVNNTGLMWEIGEEIGAVLAFAEHRYFGESVPDLKRIENCMAFVSSEQALADYATLIPRLKRRLGLGEGLNSKVIAFGGSYGGMLAAWFRMRYPHVCNGGALSASGPILGFPSSKPLLDGSSIAMSRGAETLSGEKDSQCHDSYLATWILLDYLLQQGKSGQGFLEKELRSCYSLDENSGKNLIQTIQSSLFNLAMSNYAFPSSYIVTGELGIKGYKLPAWPMRKACHFLRQPKNLLVVDGNRTNVTFEVRYILDNDELLDLNVQWNVSESPYQAPSIDKILSAPVVRNLVTGIRNVHAMWANVTGNETCLDYSVGGELKSKKSKRHGSGRTGYSISTLQKTDIAGLNDLLSSNTTCTADTLSLIESWNAIVCNDGMNFVQGLAYGYGHDIFWPPNVPRGEIEANYSAVVESFDGLKDCRTPLNGKPGATSDPKLLDVFGDSMLAQYGGRDFWMYGSSNIIFSNGEYDPWTGAGVTKSVPESSIYSILIPQAAHHSDLMFPTTSDPAPVLRAREKEKCIIRSWIYSSKNDTIEC